MNWEVVKVEFRKLSIEELKAIDCFSLFHIDENSSDEEVRKAHRKLSVLYHPDIHNNEEEALQMTQLINAKYSLIKNADLRKDYKRNRYARDKLQYEQYKRQTQSNAARDTSHQETSNESDHFTRPMHQEQPNTTNSNEIVVSSQEDQEESEFQEWLNHLDPSYRKLYLSYYNDLMQLEVDPSVKRGMSEKRTKQIVRELARKYTDDFLKSGVNHERARNK